MSYGYGYGYGLFNVINQYIHDYHSHGILVNPLVFMQLWCSSGSSHTLKMSSQEDELTGRGTHRKRNSQEDELGTAQPQLVSLLIS